MRRVLGSMWLLALGLALGLEQPAAAVITALTPLKDFLTAHLVFTATVESVDAERPAMVLKVEESLKGKAPFGRLPVNLAGDSEAKKTQQTAQLLKRVAPGTPLVITATLRGKRYEAFCYTNGTWFQMLGFVDTDGQTVRWGFTHLEPYLRRTFKGTTAELRQVVVDGLSGKKPFPEPDAKEPPGLGPELAPKPKEEKDKGARLAGGPPLAVIPTFVIMGPLALLAALFPAVFGGLAIFMRRWLVLLSVACTTSTIFTLHVWLGGYLSGWWATPAALWTVLTAVTLLGAVWSGWRYRRLQQAGQEVGLPSRGERLTLWAAGLLGAAVVAYNLLDGGAGELLRTPWKELLVFWVGAWAGLCYVFYLMVAPNRTSASALPVELIVLWGMVFASANLGMLSAAGERPAAQFEPGEVPADAGRVIRPDGLAWTFDAGSGSIFSSPLVSGDRVYAASIESAGFSRFGVVYCLERDTGRKVWQFDDDGDLKQVFSSPTVADGRVYIGEGLHENQGCRFYCLDAATGQKLWQFETSSHTESSPCVSAGKVFFGAGDDGIYCCDAASGKKLWHFQQNLHVDVSPVVVGDRLYAGSGVSRTQSTTEVFCLSIADGRPLWRMPTDLPVWGSPAIEGEYVYVGLGNGRFSESADSPKGALLCLEADTGRRIWRYDVADAVLVRPAVDAHHVYFGARDGQVYCLDRFEGRLRWKHDLGSPVVASPALARCSCCDASTSLFAIASGGRVACLDAATGRLSWAYDLAREAGATPILYSSPTVQVRRDGSGERRRIYFGAALQNAVTGSLARLYCLQDRVEPARR